MEISWLTKLAIKFWPKQWLKHMAGQQKIDARKLDWVFKLFEGARIDFFPLNSGNGRGFMIVVDQKFSLWFYQDGDHFVFDGYEMGEYAPGKITVLDGLESIDFEKN
jgi:hypothetical protein